LSFHFNNSSSHFNFQQTNSCLSWVCEMSATQVSIFFFPPQRKKSKH
jgi:hypothetical protein